VDAIKKCMCHIKCKLLSSYFSMVLFIVRYKEVDNIVNGYIQVKKLLKHFTKLYKKVLADFSLNFLLDSPVKKELTTRE